MGIEAVAADHNRVVEFADELRRRSSALARPLVDRMIGAQARCYDPRGVYTDLFHSDDPRDIARAKAICARCTVRDACLRRAIERAEPCGVWGGELLLDGQIASYPRRRGRRPNVLAPVCVDEVLGTVGRSAADAV